MTEIGAGNGQHIKEAAIVGQTLVHNYAKGGFG